MTVEPKIIGYITTMVRRTREHRQLTLGASPRATVALLQASKTLALMRGRLFITPDDVKDMAVPVLRHRILLKPEAEIEGVSADRVLRSMIESVEVSSVAESRVSAQIAPRCSPIKFPRHKCRGYGRALRAGCP